ncbi:hypothetical protein HAHE_05680 [Haloferula helveola]|uniref:MurNAc-LAA domain-containing protein n=1 Tax=Haloferula helveola TaxID=490095 RepID=A0ABN6GZE1_9BACT|nr:hypothetical protein HAHE_05680 [Haloferula helveola]
MKAARSIVPLLLVGIIAIGAGIWFWLESSGEKEDPAKQPELPAPAAGQPEPKGGTTPTPPVPPKRPPLSDLAEVPDWNELNRWQSTVTRSEFTSMLQEVFTVSPAWRQWFHIGESDVLIETGVPDERFRLRFAKPGLASENPRDWRAAAELGPAPPGLPLDGLRIAIDPGHIGGPWAKIEERWFQIDSEIPVKEGDLTLLVAQLLKPRLEALGAEVELVRESTEPVTDYRPETLMEKAREMQPDTPRQLAERLFYRTAEIRARADLVNRRLRPDLVLCLHFNAEGWGNPAKPTLVNRHHLHLLLNGAYTDDEVGLADQRYQIVRKIVEKIHPEETAVAKSVASRFVEASKLPPYLYEIDSRRAVNIDGNPYLWARNLLANRLYNRPVVFLEPYVMNSKADYARIQAGDFEGRRPVAGKPQPSIFREYADAVAGGLADYYRDARPAG